MRKKRQLLYKEHNLLLTVYFHVTQIWNSQKKNVPRSSALLTKEYNWMSLFLLSDPMKSILGAKVLRKYDLNFK